MTALTKPVSRETNRRVGKRPVIITIAPRGQENEALIGLRLKGQRLQYVITLSDVYRLAAMWHGQKEKAARLAARRNGVPWRTAKRQFDAVNRI